MRDCVAQEVVSMVWDHQLISRGHAGGLHDCGRHGDREHRAGDSLSGHEQSQHRRHSRAQRARPHA
jgi:hypothetical protein